MLRQTAGYEATTYVPLRAVQSLGENLQMAQATGALHCANLMNRSQSAPLIPVQTLALLKCLQFLARLEANRFPGRNRDLSSGPGIAPDPRFPRPHIENSKASQLNPVSL